jgi:aminopeptidase N
MWAADPEFIHKTRQVRSDLTLHLLYKPTNATAEQWEKILDDAEKALPFIEKTFGAYPWKQYSFIHGGDGGMEYPMATLLAAPGAWLHEWMHSWYQGMMATNESLYAWMDEGFTSYAESRVSAFLANDTGFEQKDSYNGYLSTVKSGREEALITHDDHYNTNYAHFNVYSKGGVFVEQLGYITGAPVRDRILLEYYRQWKFKHPTAADFLRIAEKVSDMKLDWYKEYFINTTRTIDYAIDSLWEEGGKTKVRLSRQGLMPMPIDLMLTFRDGSQESHYIPLDLMYGQKANETPAIPRFTYDAWKWTHPTFVIETSKKLRDFTTVEIDPSMRLADVERRNNKLELKW